MACCKGHTYRCDRCEEKFCERCQSSREHNNLEYCYTCYYIVKGHDDEQEQNKRGTEVKKLTAELEHAHLLNACRYKDGLGDGFDMIRTLLKEMADPINREELIKKLDECEKERGWWE